MIILKLACSKLFCLGSVVAGTWLMIFQSSYRVAESISTPRCIELRLQTETFTAIKWTANFAGFEYQDPAITSP